MSKNKDYEVGYKRPPKDKRFPKGKSGNPHGRPKNSDKKLRFRDDINQIIIDEAREEVIVNYNKGERIAMSSFRGAIKQLKQKALQGDRQAIKDFSILVKAASSEEKVAYDEAMGVLFQAASEVHKSTPEQNEKLGLPPNASYEIFESLIEHIDKRFLDK